MDGRFYAELLFLAAALGAVLTFAVWGRDKRVLPRMGEFFAVLGLTLMVVQATRSSVVTGWIQTGIARLGVDITVSTAWRVIEVCGLSSVGGGVLLLSMIAGQERRRRDSDRAIADAVPGVSREMLQSVLATTPSATMIIRRLGGVRRGFVVSVAGDSTRQLLRPPAGVLAEPPLSLHKPAAFAEAVADVCERAFAAGSSAEAEWSPEDSGSCYGVRASVRGEVIVVMIDDISDRKRTETALSEIAYKDPVTGLANRAGAQRAIDVEADGVRAGERRAFALFYLDFDGFKAVNDEHGHDAGDALLASIGARIRSCLIESGYKRGNDFVAGRWGGDEFVVMLREPSRLLAWQAAERLCEALSHAHELAGVRVTSTASVGMAWCKGDHASGADAVSDADRAMYQAKHSGKNRVVVAQAVKDTPRSAKYEGPRDAA